MTMPRAASWESWAPPLNPPDPDGLDRDTAAAIAADWWDCEPHLAAALMWESYAATLPPSPTVTQVNTGAQLVSYHPPAPLGPYGLAVTRAAWHRSFLEGGLVSVPLTVAPVDITDDRDLLPDMDWWIDP